MPSAIASSAGMNLSHVSRALRELEEKSLVECLTPKMTKNKIYGITPSGLSVIEKMKMLDKE
jgi:predicted transcriptional regulator